MQYNSPCIDPVYDVIRDAAEQVGLDAFRSDRDVTDAVDLRERTRREIDESVILVAEVTTPNWWVASELIYAFDRKPCILLFQQPPPSCLQAEDAPTVFGTRYRIEYSLRSPEARDKARKKVQAGLEHSLRQLDAFGDKLADWLGERLDLLSVPRRGTDGIPASLGVRERKAQS